MTISHVRSGAEHDVRDALGLQQHLDPFDRIQAEVQVQVRASTDRAASGRRECDRPHGRVAERGPSRRDVPGGSRCGWLAIDFHCRQCSCAATRSMAPPRPRQRPAAHVEARDPLARPEATTPHVSSSNRSRSRMFTVAPRAKRRLVRHDEQMTRRRAHATRRASNQARLAHERRSARTALRCDAGPRLAAKRRAGPGAGTAMAWEGIPSRAWGLTLLPEPQRVVKPRWHYVRFGMFPRPGAIVLLASMCAAALAAREVVCQVSPTSGTCGGGSARAVA